MKKIKNLFVALLAIVPAVAFAQTFPVNNISISGTMTGPTQGANTVLANTANTTGAASPTTLPNCTSQALSYTPGTGFGCVTLTANNITYNQGSTGAVTRFLTPKLQEKASVLDFSGCDPTGNTDSTVCIQNAINAASSGLEVDIPPGTYVISSTLNVGNGTSSGASTSNGQVLIGLTAGSVSNEGPVFMPVQFKWTGASGGTMMSIQGPIWGVKVEGISFNANSLANTCMNITHVMNSTFKDVLCTNYTATAFIQTAYPEPVGVVVGSSDNVFMNFMAKSPATGGSGFLIGGTSTGTSKRLDVARNVYINDHFDFDGHTPTSYGIALQFVDNISFMETTTARSNGGSGGVGLFVNPPTAGTGQNLFFPANIQFYNSPIQGNVALPASANWTPATGIGFWPYPSGDGEVVPVGNNPGNVYGITDAGVFFGASGGTPVYNNLGTVQYNNHMVFGSVQLSGGAASVSFFGAAVFTSINSYACTATDESTASAVKALNSAGNAISLSGNGTDFINYICIGH